MNKPDAWWWVQLEFVECIFVKPWLDYYMNAKVIDLLLIVLQAHLLWLPAWRLGGNLDAEIREAAYTIYLVSLIIHNKVERGI